MGQVAAQGFAALVQVLHLGRVIGRFVKRDVCNLAVWNRNIETVAKGFDVFVGEFLGLVHIVFALATLAHAKTFDRFDQQHCGLAFVVDRCVVRGVDFFGVMATAAQLENLFVTHVRHHCRGARVFAKEVFANVRAVIGFHSLVVAIKRVHHQLAQSAVFVPRQKWVPTAAPQKLDNVPARATELAFEFLNDLAVAPNRAVQTLQVAVNHEDEVIQTFTRGQSDSA